MSPTVAGITVEVAYSANYQFIVSNTTPQPVTFLADSGEPFLEIGPEGVRGNFASPAFYDSNNPGGRSTFPPQAKPGPDVPPIWRKLSRRPELGVVRPPPPPDRAYRPARDPRAKKVTVLGRWKVPLRLGDQTGELQGRFEYRPPPGPTARSRSRRRSPAPRRDDPGRLGSAVPAIFVKNESSDPVVVLGKNKEPFARIGPSITEVNVQARPGRRSSRRWGRTRPTRPTPPPSRSGSRSARPRPGTGSSSGRRRRRATRRSRSSSGARRSRSRRGRSPT